MSQEPQPIEPKKNQLGKTWKPYKMQKAVDQFCRAVAGGSNYSEAYRIAYKKAKCLNPQRLLKRQDVQDRIKILKGINWEAEKMEKAEQQAYLARVVRTPIGEVTEKSDLAQEYTEETTVDKLGNITTTKKVKMVPKAVALSENAKIEGMYFADQPENKTPGFAFLIDFAKFIESGAAKQVDQQRPAIDV